MGGSGRTAQPPTVSPVEKQTPKLEVIHNLVPHPGPGNTPFLSVEEHGSVLTQSTVQDPTLRGTQLGVRGGGKGVLSGFKYGWKQLLKQTREMKVKRERPSQKNS